MSQYDELKRLAEAAQEDPNSPYLPCPVAFMNAATPSVVLSLIAENEELGRYLCTCRDCGGEGSLHTGDWNSYSPMEPPEPVMEKCGECDGTGMLGEIQDLYQVITERDQLRAEVAGFKTGYQAYEQVNAELKAENEVLRDGANFRAIQSLRQDCEALRKALGECADSLHGEMLQKFGGQLLEDMHPVTRRDYDRDMAELAGYRAAMGKGEQP